MLIVTLVSNEPNDWLTYSCTLVNQDETHEEHGKMTSNPTWTGRWGVTRHGKMTAPTWDLWKGLCVCACSTKGRVWQDFFFLSGFFYSVCACCRSCLLLTAAYLNLNGKAHTNIDIQEREGGRGGGSEKFSIIYLHSPMNVFLHCQSGAGVTKFSIPDVHWANECIPLLWKWMGRKWKRITW